MRPRRIGGRTGATGFLVLLLAQVSLPGQASAVGLKAFSGSATAEGVRLSLSATNAPVTNTPVDGTAPIAEAALDSLGSSEAFASSPYPGYYAVAGPGLIRALSQGRLDLPGYPLYARSEYPAAPQQQVEHPLVALAAESSENHARGVARSGLDQDATTSSGVRQLSEAAVRAAENRTDATADASSSVYGLRVGPLALTEFQARARIVRSATGETTRTATSGGSGRFGSVEFRISDDGIHLADQSVAEPPEPAEPLEVVSGHGASLTWLRPEADDRHVASPVLILTFEQPVPGNISPVGMRIVIGRAQASLTTESLPEGAPQQPVVPKAESEPPSSPGPVPPGIAAESAPPSAQLPARPVPARTGRLPEYQSVAEPAGSEAQGVLPPTPAASVWPARTPTAAAVVATSRSPASYRSTYAITVLVGCAMLAGAALVRASSRRTVR